MTRTTIAILAAALACAACRDDGIERDEYQRAARTTVAPSTSAPIERPSGGVGQPSAVRENEPSPMLERGAQPAADTTSPAYEGERAGSPARTASAGAAANADEHAIEGSGTIGVTAQTSTPTTVGANMRNADRTRQGTGATDALRDDESDTRSGIGTRSGPTGTTLTER